MMTIPTHAASSTPILTALPRMKRGAVLLGYTWLAAIPDTLAMEMKRGRAALLLLSGATLLATQAKRRVLKV